MMLYLGCSTDAVSAMTFFRGCTLYICVRDRFVRCYAFSLLRLYNRFVMTKIHPIALGGKLDGAADGSISARLRALQFLTADDLNAAVHARDDTVLALAQVCFLAATKSRSRWHNKLRRWK